VREIMIAYGSIRVGIGRPGLVDPVITRFDQSALQSPDTREKRLAIALYREAGGLNSAPYQFLGYFKIINIARRRGSDQIAWINSALPHVVDQPALARLEQLRGQHPDVGAYLYESGRCAVAHAAEESVVDPDDPADLLRLSLDLPLIRILAEAFMENELQLKGWPVAPHRVQASIGEHEQ